MAPAQAQVSLAPQLESPTRSSASIGHSLDPVTSDHERAAPVEQDPDA